MNIKGESNSKNNESIIIILPGFGYASPVNKISIFSCFFFFLINIKLLSLNQLNIIYI